MNMYEEAEISNKTILIPYYYCFPNGISLVSEEKSKFKVNLGFTEELNFLGFRVQRVSE